MPTPIRSRVEPLLDASASETVALLLELARRQAGRRRPSDLLTQYLRDGYVVPSFLDQRAAHQLDGLALAAAADYEALLLSPVAPLGSCSALAASSQHRTLTTMRGNEVVSDPTNVLALESAKRLRAGKPTRVRLCTVHQTLRAQPLPKSAGQTRHFKLFVMTEAGPGLAEDGFEVQAIADQLAVFDHLFDTCSATLGFAFPERRALLRIAKGRETLAERVRARLAQRLPHVQLASEEFTSAYYDGVRVSFGASGADGHFVPIGDLGVFDWLAKLLSNRRMRFVASGFGLQLVPVLFGETVTGARRAR